MEIVITAINVIQIAFMLWLGLSVSYMLIYSICGFFYKSTLVELKNGLPKIAVFIPSYKEDFVILSVAKEAIKHRYNGEFEVIVIADSLQPKTIDELKSLPLQVIEVDFEESTKTKALNWAMDIIGDSYDVAMILDADNVMDEGALNKIGSKYAAGHKAIQGHRTAKNQDNGFAILDGISEEMNNQIYCKGPNVFGFSSRLLGSGMAFDYALFKKLMKPIKAIGGFDKVLEMKFIENKITIVYLHEATIFDEKVNQAEVFAKQRTRWISAQYYYMRKFVPGAFLHLLRGNLDYFNKAYQLTLPPRMLLPVLLLFFCTLSWCFGTVTLSTIWTTIFAGNVVAYSISIPKKFWTKSLLKAALDLPNAVFIVISIMFKLKGANQKFIHTPHESVKVTDPKKDKTG